MFLKLKDLQKVFFKGKAQLPFKHQFIFFFFLSSTHLIKKLKIKKFITSFNDTLFIYFNNYIMILLSCMGSTIKGLERSKKIFKMILVLTL